VIDQIWDPLGIPAAASGRLCTRVHPAGARMAPAHHRYRSSPEVLQVGQDQR
jgi:hypothetical protein